MNKEYIEELIKSALPNAPKSIHDFYLDIIEEIKPKTQTFSKDFGDRGEANYALVHFPSRINLHRDGDSLSFSPAIEKGLLLMHGTDGTIALEEMVNYDAPRGISMLDKVNDSIRSHQYEKKHEIGMRFIAHGISYHQLGKTPNVEMSGNDKTQRVITNPFVHGDSINAEISNKLDKLFHSSNSAAEEHLPLSLYLQSVYGLNESLSETERNAFLERNGNTFTLSSFFDTRVMYELNGQQSGLGSVAESQLQLSQIANELIAEAYDKTAREIFSPAIQNLSNAAKVYSSDDPINDVFGRFALQHYPAAMVNFIVSAKGNSEVESHKAMAHRKLFIEAMADIAGVNWFDEISMGKINRSDKMEDFLSKFRSIFDPNKHSHHFIDNVMSHVDKGKVPRALIAEQFGVKYISKNQFSKAFQLKDEDLTTAFALSKLPDNWFEGTDMFSRDIDIRQFSPHDNIRSGVNDKGEDVSKTLNSIGYGKIKTYLVRTGQHLADLDSQLQRATQSGNPETASETKLRINREKKIVSQQYSWLSKKPDAVNAIMQFDEQFKVNATLNDYERLMKTFLDALAMRAAYDVVGSNGLDVDEEGKIELKEKVVANELFNQMVEDEINYRHELDSDHRDYGDEEVHIDTIEIDGFGSLFDKCWSIKDAADNNDRLHKSMSSISKSLGGYSTNDVSWKGLIDDPVTINGFNFIPITSRKRLLQEGVTQNHCVYTLLNPCLSGETSVFSIEDEDGVVVATMEVSQEEYASGLEHENAQLYGPNNSGVSKELQNAGNIFIEQLNDGVLSPICLEDENDASELFDTDNVEEIADLQLVPFLTDAIYDAYGIVRDHLPTGVTFRDILEKSDGMYTLFIQSNSGQDILAMDRLAEIYELNTQQVVDLAKYCPVRLIVENYNRVYSLVHEATHKKDLARIINQHSMNDNTIEVMTKYAEEYEDEAFYPLWSWIEDNVETYPEGMDEDSFRRCLREVINHECAGKGMQELASTLMKESQEAESSANRCYSLMASYLPEHLSPAPLMNAFSDDTKQRIQRLKIGEIKQEREETNSLSM